MKPAASSGAGLKNFNAHKQYLCRQNLLDGEGPLEMMYGKHRDPNREPCSSPDLKGDSPADPNFVKLRLFGLFVKAVFTLPILSAIIEMLFSRSATLLWIGAVRARACVWLPAQVVEMSARAHRQEGRRALLRLRALFLF